MINDADLAAKIFDNTDTENESAKPSKQPSQKAEANGEETDKQFLDRVSDAMFKGPEPQKDVFANDNKTDEKPEADKKPQADKADNSAKDEKNDDGRPVTKDEAEIIEKAEKLAEEVEMNLEGTTEEQAEVATEFVALAAELDLEPEQLSKFVELHEKTNQAEWQASSEAWREASLAQFDDAQLDAASEALRTYASEDLIAYIDDSGLGNYGPLIEMLSRIGADIKNG